MMKKLNRYLSYIFLYAVSLFIRPFIKIDKQLLVFSARGGAGFEGNTKYLFLYAIHHTNYKCVWYTKSKDVQKYMASCGYDCRYYFSISALVTALKAQGVFITHSLSDVMPIFYNKKSLIFDLWHGIPIKNVSFLDPNLGFKSRLMDYYKSRRLNYFISNSKDFEEVYMKCFKLNVDKIKSLGYTRIEALLKYKTDENNNDILYAPTFREYRFDNPLLEFSELKKINHLLLSNNIKLLIKLHPSENLDTSFNFSNIDVIDSSVDIYELLPKVGRLISDYSSVALDFISAYPNKQVAFFVPDIEQYKKYRSFAFDYESEFQNAIFFNTEDLLNQFCHCKDFSRVFNENRNSCQYILELLDNDT
ncbi:CDP-glycerol glycerophosphotransferase family protein [Vibrio fluvialis]|nr:CDP-glycerol glycerophosphotransferase family protein [Vibrio fluvialis]